MVREIDTRLILGNGGTVMLVSNDEGYCVSVAGWNGETVATIPAKTTAEALDAFLHPFARPDVPDIFKSSFQDDERETWNDSDDDEGDEEAPA